MENVLKNFVTLEMFRFERPRLSTMTDDQIQEALNIASGLLDSVCNGLISLVVQYSLSREVKDENHELFRSDFELQQIKNAIVFQAQYVLNLGNDFTIGSSSASTGGINYSFQRPESRQELAPGVKEFLSRARVFELTNIGASSKKQDCGILKTLLDIEDGDRRYLQKYQPNAEVGSIATIGEGHTISFVNPSNTPWAVKQAEMIVDKGGDYHYLWEYPELAFFGDNVNNAISKKEAYQAIWNAMWWNKMTTYPNEAIVRYYDYDNNIVYTYKSNQDGNIGHNPLKDNQDEHWWKLVLTNDNIDVQALANSVLDSKEFNDFLSKLKQEIDNNNEALWEQIKDNPHLLKKFEELYDQTQVENEQLETKLDTKIEANKTSIDTINQSLVNVAFVNKKNRFNTDQAVNGYIDSYKGFWWQGANLRLGTLKYQTTKQISFMFIQDKNVGYRNFSGFALQHKISTQADADAITFFKVELRNTITTMNCWGNYLEFEELTRIGKVDTPTNDNDVANKKYVDDAIANGGGGVDLTQYAKLSESNVFGRDTTQTFNNIEVVNLAGFRQYPLVNISGYEEPTQDLELVPKFYVDENNTGTYIYESGLHEFRINKKDIVSGLFYYFVHDINIPVSLIPSKLFGKKCIFIAEINSLELPSGQSFRTSIYLGSYNVNIGNNDTLIGATSNIGFVLNQDLKPGAIGEIVVDGNYKVILIEVK